MPKEATRIIHFLNSKNKYELQELEIQLKQANLETTPTTVITTVTTPIPSTWVGSLAPTAPMATTLPASTPSTSATGWIGDEASKLVKEMENMSIQTTEMNKLKEKVTSLEIDYKLAQIIFMQEDRDSYWTVVCCPCLLGCDVFKFWYFSF